MKLPEVSPKLCLQLYFTFQRFTLFIKPNEKKTNTRFYYVLITKLVIADQNSKINPRNQPYKYNTDDNLLSNETYVLFQQQT